MSLPRRDLTSRLGRAAAWPLLGRVERLVSGIGFIAGTPAPSQPIAVLGHRLRQLRWIYRLSSEWPGVAVLTGPLGNPKHDYGHWVELYRNIIAPKEPARQPLGRQKLSNVSRKTTRGAIARWLRSL
jgi:hypothetical protein